MQYHVAFRGATPWIALGYECLEIIHPILKIIIQFSQLSNRGSRVKNLFSKNLHRNYEELMVRHLCNVYPPYTVPLYLSGGRRRLPARHADSTGSRCVRRVADISRWPPSPPSIRRKPLHFSTVHCYIY